MWANPSQVIPGKVREVSPVADPATRTYAVKVSIPDSAEGVKLGQTALVQFSSTTDMPLIRVPLTALFHEKATTSVWIVENNVVKLVPVQIGGTSGNEVVLVGGVKSGQTVVTAGVNLLKQGQKVKIMPPERSASDTTPLVAVAEGAK
jgi:RND family efflux transporter MFP subunit